MVFDKRKTRPEERIATQSAKWDEDYRARKGIRNVFARPLAGARPGADRGDLPDRLPGALAPRLRPARRPARPRRRGLVPRGQRQPLHQLRPRHGQRGGEGGHGLLPVHPAAGGRGDAPAMSARSATRKRRTGPASCAASAATAAAYWRLLPQLRPRAAAGGTLDSVTGAECYHCGWMVVGQVLLLPLVRRRHLRGGLLQRGARSRRRKGFRMDARCDWGCGGGVQYPMRVLPLVRPAAELERGRTCSRASAPTAAAGWTTG